MINLRVVSSAIEVLEDHYRRSVFLDYYRMSQLFFARGDFKRSILKMRCKGLVLHDRILTGRHDEKSKLHKNIQS